MKKQILWIALAALVVAFAAWFIFTPAKPEPKSAKQQQDATPKTRKFADAKAARSQPKAERTRAKDLTKQKTIINEDDEFTPEERILADKIQDALDDDNFKALQAEIEKLAASTNDALREKAVEALSWFGVKALPEMTLFMADTNDDIRDAACTAWTMSVSEIEDKNLRGSAVLSAMSVVHDRDHLDSMVMEINDMSNSEQLEILTQLIEGKNKLAAQTAKEHYEFVTGEEYKDLATAQKWLNENPDEPDESEEPAPAPDEANDAE